MSSPRTAVVVLCHLEELDWFDIVVRRSAPGMDSESPIHFLFLVCACLNLFLVYFSGAFLVFSYAQTPTRACIDDQLLLLTFLHLSVCVQGHSHSWV